MSYYILQNFDEHRKENDKRMNDKIASLVNAMTDLELKKGKYENTVRDLEKEISKMHLEIRQQKSINESNSVRILNMEVDAKIFRNKEQRFDTRINQYVLTLRDMENRNQQLKIKFQTLNKTSTMVMKKIMAITFKLKRQYVSNADLTIEYEKLS